MKTILLISAIILGSPMVAIAEDDTVRQGKPDTVCRGTLSGRHCFWPDGTNPPGDDSVSTGGSRLFQSLGEDRM